MALRELAGSNKRGTPVIEVCEPDEIRDRSPIKTNSIRNGLMRQTELIRKPPQRPRALDRVEILALHILDQSEFGRALVIEDANQRRERLKADQLRGAPAAFAGDELETVTHGAHQDRLHEARLADGGGKALDERQVEVGSRLAWIGNDVFHGDLTQKTGARSRGGF